MKGDSLLASPNHFFEGNYGSKGVFSDANKPGSRQNSSTWTDEVGYLWLFGGNIPGGGGSGDEDNLFNDLWKYKPVSNQWVWINGNASHNKYGIYGTIGIAGQNKMPWARRNSQNWTDGDGNFWIFGGYGYTANVTNIPNNPFSPAATHLNDLWKYEKKSDKWTWVKGNFVTTTVSNFGTYGVSAPTNAPGARYGAVSWSDTAGNFWLFGGTGYASNQLGNLNDLWMYDPRNNEWSWYGGDSTVNGRGRYGMKGQEDSPNKPGARFGGTGWSDQSGNFWIFGGNNGQSIISPTIFNDLWNYNSATHKWKWLSGDSTGNFTYDSSRSIFGIQGESAQANTPGSRYFGTGKADANGNLLLFGGNCNWPQFYLNELWKYTLPDKNIAPIVSIISPSNNSQFTAKDNISVDVQAVDPDGIIKSVEFLYTLDGSPFIFGKDSIYPYQITAPDVSSGVYKLFAKASDNNGQRTYSDTFAISVNGCSPSGYLKGEGYTNIPGSQVTDLTSHPSYPDSPTIRAQLDIFEYSGVGKNYDGKLKGYICAPLTGNYIFYIAGDDQAGLFLSTDEDSAHKALIAYNLSPVGFREWNATAYQKSEPVFLVKGARYYIETLHKQSTGIDWMSVGWQMPDGVVEKPIPGIRLSPLIQNSLSNANRNFHEAILSLNTKMSKVQALSVTVIPNPSPTYFSVIVNSIIKEKVSVTVLDLTGRIVEGREVGNPDDKVEIGKGINSPGVYIVEVKQGKQVKRAKIVKQ